MTSKPERSDRFQVRHVTPEDKFAWLHLFVIAHQPGEETERNEVMDIATFMKLLLNVPESRFLLDHQGAVVFFDQYIWSVQRLLTIKGERNPKDGE